MTADENAVPSPIVEVAEPIGVWSIVISNLSIACHFYLDIVG